MRLFAYYALHTFKNQVKKLLKTWVLIFFLVCFAVGAGIGLLAAVLDDAGEDVPPAEENVEGESFLEASGVTREQVTELAAGGAALLVFFFCAVNADKNGSKIFLPADVNLLFPSPMKPQSVLMFRLSTQVGIGLLGSVYMLFQVPNLTLNLGLDLWAALALVLAWGLAIAIGAILQLSLYILSATYPAVKRNLRRALYLLIAAVAAAFMVFASQSGAGLFKSAVLFFNGRLTRWIPFWGWLKGFCAFAAEGNGAGAALSLLALLLGGGALVYLTWRVKADFYEDAMAKSQETAELLAAAQSERSAAVVRRKKDRSERLRRDGMDRGNGANVFFFKAMYNRRRFAHLGVFTKTMETYLLAAAAVAGICRFAAHMEGFLPVALTLGALAFFRSLGNPLEQDTGTDCFLMIPESARSKLFWSLMGGTVNCLLDVLPAVVLGALVMGANPLTALLWVPFIVSVDLYATTVGAFIGLSVPVSAGKTLKQVVQIMFVYFGLLPDIVIAVIGIALGRPYVALILAAALNIALGFIFFALLPGFIEPGGGRKIKFEGDIVMEDEKLKAAKRRFSRLGLAMLVIFVSAALLQILAGVAVKLIWPDGDAPGWTVWAATFVPMYLVGMPLGVLVMRRVPASPRETRPMSAGRLLTAGAVSVFLMYVGNIVGVVLLAVIEGVSGHTAVNPLLGYAMDDNVWLRAIVMAVLAPIFEELIFRKLLIDRMSVYGERLAVFTSALMFGIFHGNLSQFFYAFALGLVFGYVYLKTGRLRYSTALHMFINLLGGVVAPAVLSTVNLEALENISLADPGAVMELAASLAPMMLYGFAMFVLTVTGLVLFCVNIRRVTFDPAPLELPKGRRFKTVWLNAGMILFVLLGAASVFLTFIQ